MKSNLLFALLTLTAASSIAQGRLPGNSINIRVTSQMDFVKGIRGRVDSSKDIILYFPDWNDFHSMTVHLTIRQLNFDSTYSRPKAADQIILQPEAFFSANKKPTDSLEVLLDASQPGNEKHFLMTLDIYTDGELSSSSWNSFPSAANPVKINTNLPDLATTKFGFSDLSEGKPVVDCRQNLVIYFPCCNKTIVLIPKKITKDSFVYKRSDYLPYHTGFSDNTGVTFVVANYNSLKYTTSLTNTFVNNFSQMPDQWTSLLQNLLTANGGPNPLAPGGVNIGGNDFQVNKFLRKLNQAVQDMKAFESLDCLGCQNPDPSKCGDFGSARKTLLDNIRTNLGSGNIIEQYSVVKQQYLDATGFKSDSFNTYFATRYLISTTPDSLAAAAQTLYNILDGTAFYSFYNIPQMQNADKIVFTLNIQPNTGQTGALNVTSQPISVPICGGWQLAWSAGFYYSTIKNETYGLRPDTTSSSTSPVEIVKEKNFHDGTLGLAAMLHAYYRWAPGSAGGFVLGIGKTTDLNYSILFGPSIGIGKDNRVAFSGGFNFSSIKALSDGQQINQSYPPTATVSTYNKMKVGAFFGLTYAFGASPSTQSASTTASLPTTPAASPTGGTGSNTGAGGGTGSTGAATTPQTNHKGKPS